MSHPDGRSRDVGSSVPVAVVVAATAALALVAVALGLWWAEGREVSRPPLVLATGPEEGAYHALGEALARLIEDEGLAPSVSVRPTEGSAENMELLSTGAVHLALVQSDTPASDAVRLVTALFDEALHVLVSIDVAAEVKTLTDITARRVSLGSSASGTRQVAERILKHFEVVPAQDLAVSPAEAVTLLEKGELDAVFVLTALPSPAIAEVTRRERVRFLTLGDAQVQGNEADALALIFPRLHATTIPRGAYGRVPIAPVSTVGVRAQMVGRSDLDDDLVFDLTAALFARRARLNDTTHNLQFGDLLSERYVPGAGGLAYHAGAIAYYERFKPSFFVEYAEPMSLGLTLLVGAWSGTLALRGWFARTKKNRIDAYYLEVVRDAPDLSRAGRDALLARRDHLVRVRERAFNDLVAERLRADESFVIFQNQVGGELASIGRRLAGMADES